MKKFLWLLPLVMGCASAPVVSAPVLDVPPPAMPVEIAAGTNGTGVEWRCELLGFTNALAFVQCDFRNNYSIPTTSGCMEVGFYSEADGRPVAVGDKLCSGDLMPGDTKTKYVAFREGRREALRKCGEGLQLCVMLAPNDLE